MSAVSKKLMPLSIDVLTSSSASAWPTAPRPLTGPLPSPNVMVPKQSLETRRPVSPSVANCLTFCLFILTHLKYLTYYYGAITRRHWARFAPIVGLRQGTDRFVTDWYNDR